MLIALFVSGCNQDSYPEEKLEQSIVEICKKEYNIHNIKVKFNDTTVGVFLPLSQLFATDFKEAVLNGKVNNVETLFEPSQEAMDKVEDVLFTISRVILSTNKKVDFYILQATDVENTGLQLILKGYVNDIKRVRVWDISRNEYRKRVIHELRLNPMVLWQKPIQDFLKDLPVLEPAKIYEKYFEEKVAPDLLQRLFFDLVYPSAPHTVVSQWQISEIRSMELNRRSAVVYVKVTPHFAPGVTSVLDGKDLEYLFILDLKREGDKISRIIPFQYINAKGTFEAIEFPSELEVAKNLKRWNEEFNVDALTIGGFIAEQLTRRVQVMLAADERIRNTIREAKLEFTYSKEPPANFSLNVDVSLRDAHAYAGESIVMNEDMLYLLEMTSREFINVVRSYGFQDYEFLKLNLVQDPTPWISAKEKLDLFRRDKIDIHSLFSSFVNV